METVECCDAPTL